MEKSAFPECSGPHFKLSRFCYQINQVYMLSECKTFQWKAWGRNIAPAIRTSLPDLLSTQENPHLRSTKILNSAFGVTDLSSACSVAEVSEVERWGSSADTDFDWLTLSKPKDLSVKRLFSRSVTAGYRGFTDQKPPLELHPETRSTLCCYVHAEDTQLSMGLPYPAPASAFKVI